MRALIVGAGGLAALFGFMVTALSMDWGWWSWVMVAGVAVLVVDSHLEELAWRRAEASRLSTWVGVRDE